LNHPGNIVKLRTSDRHGWIPENEILLKSRSFARDAAPDTRLRIVISMAATMAAHGDIPNVKQSRCECNQHLR
jgi:hypothetical protein